MADDSNQDPKGNEANDSWRRIKGFMGDAKTSGQQAAKGVVDMATGHERKPCYTCKSWEQNERKVAQHFTAHGLKIQPDGTITTPIAKDFKGRSDRLMYTDAQGQKQAVRVQAMGWCRWECRSTEFEATCPKFHQVTRREEMAQRLALGDRIRLH